MIKTKTVALNKLTEMKLDIPEEELKKASKKIADAMIKHVEYSLLANILQYPTITADWLKDYSYPVKPIKFEVTTKYGPSIE